MQAFWNCGGCETPENPKTCLCAYKSKIHDLVHVLYLNKITCKPIYTLYLVQNNKVKKKQSSQGEELLS